MKSSSYTRALAAAALLGGTAMGGVDSAVSDQLLVGIDRQSGALVKFDFAAGTKTTVGTVKTKDGTTIKGLDAGAYFPGFTNMYALWADPSDDKNKLVYINLKTAGAAIVVNDLEGGKFTGATGLNTAAFPHTVFAMQAIKIKPPATISGAANINPNNSQDNEFSLTKGNGQVITRDDLKQNAPVDGNGTFYQGDATLIHLKPKGNGNQNSLVIDGAAFLLQNSNTYDFAGQMQVRLWNDQIKNAKAMGHWWITITSGTVVINNDVQVLSPNRITKVSQKDGTVTEIMPLSRTYTGLATTDGVTFYAMHGDDLYRIDTVGQTETLVGDTSLTTPTNMNFVGQYLMTYDINNFTVVPLNSSTAANEGTPANLGTGGLGAAVFTPAAQDPTKSPEGYD